ncbi:MAG: 50S ribosomal protein L9 [Bacilli bacterium]|nr:50S ribosomal protein L9 [Bacilli bacterium]
MRVILLEDVKKQGKKGQTINVKDGYGNYLITNNLAVLETKGSKAVLDKQNKLAKETEENLINECNKIKDKLAKMTLEFKVKVGKNDQVFGTISTKQIASELKNKGIEIDKRKIKIDIPINTLGITEVDIELHKEVIAKVKVHLTK